MLRFLWFLGLKKKKKIYEVDLKFYVLILILRVLWCDFGGFCERDLGLGLG